jgi:TetR/AcrR family transcriptional regulator, cholesterol catabolism regulator
MARPKNSGAGNLGQTSEKLMAVAIKLFSEKGFKGTSLRDIAAEAGVTSGNIFHHFGSKQGLLAAIEKQKVEPIMSELRRITALEMPAIDRLKLLLKTHLTYIGLNLRVSNIFFLNSEYIPSNSEKLQAEIYHIYRSEIGRVQSTIGRTAKSTIAAFCTLGVMNWLLKWYRPEGPSTLEEVIDEIIDYVLGGLAGRQSPNQFNMTTLNIDIVDGSN